MVHHFIVSNDTIISVTYYVLSSSVTLSVPFGTLRMQYIEGDLNSEPSHPSMAAFQVQLIPLLLHFDP